MEISGNTVLITGGATGIGPLAVLRPPFLFRPGLPRGPGRVPRMGPGHHLLLGVLQTGSETLGPGPAPGRDPFPGDLADLRLHGIPLVMETES